MRSGAPTPTAGRSPPDVSRTTASALEIGLLARTVNGGIEIEASRHAEAVTVNGSIELRTR